MEFQRAGNYRNLPVAVLVGRPNVGKSTLFNRLLRRRRAITDPKPGVTRDPVEAEAFIGGKPVRLVDTGGFRLSDLGELDAVVVERTLETLDRADLVILVLDAAEITGEDERFMELLRPRRDRLMVAVNKCEGGRNVPEAWNLLSRGFEKLWMVSAEHGDNIAAFEAAVAQALDFSRVEAAPVSRPVRVAIVGKPNTGKSTLSNRLTSSPASIVSDIPGTTRDVIEGGFSWKGKDFVSLDTAGIRRKSKVTQNIEYYSVNRAIKAIEEADIVFLLIDAEEGLTDQDKKIAGLAHDLGRGIIFALNKWDVMPKIKNSFEAARDKIRYFFAKMDYAPVVALSALDGAGVDKLLDTALAMFRQLNRRVETGRLNQALARWLEEYPPPAGPRGHFRVKYAVQSSENPVRFIFFVSRRRVVSEAYVSYLRNRARKELGFSLVPVGIELRSSSPEKAGASSGRGRAGRS